MIAGVDEVGRGPLAGPVVAAAVILSDNEPISGLKDSKKLSSKRRELLYKQIYQQSLAVSVGWSCVEEIDKYNILQASLMAMSRAFVNLAVVPSEVLVDGNRLPVLSVPAQAIIGGDGQIDAIMAASIVAKVERDRYMAQLELSYPGYGFAQHAGYPTKGHLQALTRLGVSPVHRRSFGPVKKLLI